MEEDKASPLQETTLINDRYPQCQGVLPANDEETESIEGVSSVDLVEPGVNGSRNELQSVVELLNFDEKLGERMSDFITGVSGVLQTDKNPDENNVEKQEMEDVCMESGTLEENPNSVEQQAKPSLGICGVKRKAETSERTSKEEDTPTATKGEEMCQRKWYCSLCEISTTSEGALNTHIQGKKHKAKEARSKSKDEDLENIIKPDVGPTNGAKTTTKRDQTSDANKWYCSLCQASATSEALLNAHFLGKKHKAKEAKNLGLVTRNGSETVKNEVITTKWYCSVCQLYAASENNLQEHFKGKKHKSKENSTNPPELEIPSNPHNVVGDEKQEMGNRETAKYWHCKMCNEGTRDEASMNDHRKSGKHRKALTENCGGVIVVSRLMAKEAVGEVGKISL